MIESLPTEPRVVGNHIYFYNDIDFETILNLTALLKELEQQILKLSIDMDNSKPEPIYLHINSFGGSYFDGLSMANSILNCKIPVYTIIDGYAASAATFMSIVGKKRLMYENSYILIHELSVFANGKFSDHEDNMKNMNKQMDMMKGLYHKYTSIPEEVLDGMLKHDIWFTAEECLSYGLIDKIIKSKR